ncbi:hypothetical protein ACET3Z_031792 [Daucus carota]
MLIIFTAFTSAFTARTDGEWDPPAPKCFHGLVCNTHFGDEQCFVRCAEMKYLAGSCKQDGGSVLKYCCCYNHLS